MKTFKIVDYWISILCILSTLVFACTHGLEMLIRGYCITGGWQICSMLVHQINGWFLQSGKNRWIYHRIVLIIAGCSLIGFGGFEWLLLLLFLMSILGLPMAIYYTWLCFREIHVYYRRPLYQLK